MANDSLVVAALKPSLAGQVTERRGSATTRRARIFLRSSRRRKHPALPLETVSPVGSAGDAGLDLSLSLCILAESKPSWTLTTSALATLKYAFSCQ